MYYAHTDFLSFEDIDAEVDRIFKAYCDTVLIGYAKDYSQDGKTYWRKVLNFRSAKFHAFERPDLVKKAAKAAPDEAAEQSDPREEDLAYARAFLYWFDMRADYWSRHEADQKLVDSLVPSSDLASLFSNARDVQARIHKAEQVSGAVRWGFWNNGNNGSKSAAEEDVNNATVQSTPPPERPEDSPSPRGTRRT